jgi:hypothetical protein
LSVLAVERFPEGLHGYGEERRKGGFVKIVVEVERKSRPAASGGWGDEGGEGESEVEGAI